MKTKWLSSTVFIFVIFVLGSALFTAWGDDDDGRHFPKNATFTTLITTPRALEGLTGDNYHISTRAARVYLPVPFGR